jgi:CMP-N-acetylneuraminic acid synthetase|tara:strand:- start:1959 stop:2630 length:672 start_codon:yes stop_codon:yes gene_type:complete
VKKITAVIPVRKGSVRVKNKNIKPFAGSSLLEIKIRQLKNVSQVDDIVVSTDCQEMAAIARGEGVKVHIRDKYHASSEATNSEFFKNLAESVECDHLMYSPVTCPLVSSETYFECLSLYKKTDIENLITTSLVKHHMWLDGQPLNYKIDDSPNSQDLPDIHKITYGICLISRENMIKYSNVITPNPTFKCLDEIESIDIDTEFDFMIAEFIFNKLKQKQKEFI